MKPPRNVAYFFDEELCNYNYGGGNPMRPHRHRLTTNLVKGYQLDEKMRIIRPEARTRDEIMHFHADGARGEGAGGWRGAAMQRRRRRRRRRRRAGPALRRCLGGGAARQLAR